MPLVEVQPDLRLHVQDLGSGRPVVLIAGFGLSHPVWDGEVRLLAEAGHRVVCIDLRGTGGSDKPLDGYTVLRLAEDVAAVLRALDLREVTLVGWSFGGQVATQLVSLARDRLDGLVLVCSNGVRGPTRSDRFPFGGPTEPLQAALIAGERTNRIASRRKAIASGFAEAPDPALVDYLLSIQLRMPSWSAIACYESYLNTDLTELLPSVTLPVLQILGERDVVASHEGARWLQGQLAEGRLAVLEGCGHYPMFEEGEAFADLLLPFCRRA